MTPAQPAVEPKHLSATPAIYEAEDKATVTAAIVAGVAGFSMLNTTAAAIGMAVTQKVSLATAFALIGKGLGLAALGTAGSIAVLYGIPVLILIGSAIALYCASRNTPEATPAVIPDMVAPVTKESLLQDIQTLLVQNNSGPTLLENYQIEFIREHLEEKTLDELQDLYNGLTRNSGTITPHWVYSTLLTKAYGRKEKPFLGTIPENASQFLGDTETDLTGLDFLEQPVSREILKEQGSYSLLPELRKKLLKLLSKIKLATILPQLASYPHERQKALLWMLREGMSADDLFDHFRASESEPTPSEACPQVPEAQKQLYYDLLKMNGLTATEATKIAFDVEHQLLQRSEVDPLMQQGKTEELLQVWNQARKNRQAAKGQ